MPQRLDTWLVCARFAKQRAVAQELVAKGHVRLNRVKMEKPGHAVKEGDVLTLSLPRGVCVVKVMGLAERRGPASAARLLYEELLPAQNLSA